MKWAVSYDLMMMFIPFLTITNHFAFSFTTCQYLFSPNKVHQMNLQYDCNRLIQYRMQWNYEKSAKFIAHLQAITGLQYELNMGQLMNQAKRIALHNDLDVGMVYEELVRQTQKLRDSNFNPLEDLVHKK